MAQGFVDLQVRGALERLDEIRELVSDQNLVVVPAGKSAAVRIEVGKVDRFGSFEEQREIVENALNAAAKLLEISGVLRDGI